MTPERIFNIGHLSPHIVNDSWTLGGSRALLLCGKVVEMSQQCLVMEKIISYASLTGSSPDIFREYKTPLLSGLREGEIRN